MDRRSRSAARMVRLVTAVALAATLASCSTGSDGPPPVSAATVPAGAASGTSTAPAATSAPSPTPPVLPDAARQPTRPGAEAFFRYFIDVYGYAFISLDSMPIRTISASDCQFCSSTVEDVDSAKTDQQRTIGGGLTASYVAAAPGEPAEGLLINAIVDQAAANLVDRHGKILEREPAHRQVRMDASVRWVAGSWQVRAVHVYRGPQT